MTIPVWMLLGFTTWTVVLLMATVGFYRWSRVFTGRAQIQDFRSDQVEGDDWYRRATRAHANCIENLPVFGAIVFALYINGVGGSTVNYLCVIVLAARLMQSLIHVSFVQTNIVIYFRFGFFSTQLFAFLFLIVLLGRHALTT